MRGHHSESHEDAALLALVDGVDGDELRPQSEGEAGLPPLVEAGLAGSHRAVVDVEPDTVQHCRHHRSRPRQY